MFDGRSGPFHEIPTGALMRAGRIQSAVNGGAGHTCTMVVYLFIYLFFRTEKTVSVRREDEEAIHAANHRRRR